MSNIRELVDRLVEDGVLTRDEHDQFIDQVSADGKIDAEEKEQISRIFNLIRDGKLKIVDTEREKFEELKRKGKSV